VNELGHLRGLADARAELVALVEKHLEQLHAELADVEAAHVSFRESLATYADRVEDDEQRLRMRTAATAVPSTHGPVHEAKDALVRALEQLATFDRQLATQALAVHDPELVRLASTAAALAAMPPEVARRCALGDVTHEELRAFLERVSAHRFISARLRADGAKVAGDVGWQIFMLPVLEAFAERNILAVFDPFHADSYPEQRPNAIAEWCRAKADLDPRPAQMPALRARLAATRKLVEEDGARTAGDAMSLETARDRARQSAAQYPQPAPRPATEPIDSQHRPAEHTQGMGILRRMFRGGENRVQANRRGADGEDEQ
jgi:hypothetical protein